MVNSFIQKANNIKTSVLFITSRIKIKTKIYKQRNLKKIFTSFLYTNTCFLSYAWLKNNLLTKIS